MQLIDEKLLQLYLILLIGGKGSGCRGWAMLFVEELGATPSQLLDSTRNYALVLDVNDARQE